LASDSRPRPKWPYIAGIAIGLLTGLVLVIVFRARDVNERTRQWVVRELRSRFNSEVELESLSVGVFPRMTVSGEGLSLRYHNRTDLPPMFHVEKFSFHLGWMGLLRAPRRIKGVYVENMTITVPPRGERRRINLQERVPSLMVDEIVCNNTDLVIVPKKEGKEPLDFDIHDLVLTSVGGGKPFKFRGNLTNAKPKGEIATNGQFGPWDADEPGDTHVSGIYKFTNANLGPLPGIGGLLSSNGNYRGQLNEIEVAGETDTPNFSLDPIGRALPLHTEFSATVNGTDGDTYLHPVRATLLQSLIVANGSVIRAPTKGGHLITLSVTTDKARLEDILLLASKSERPFMTGGLNLNTKFVLPPGPAKVLDRLKLDGNFAVTEGQWASAEVREKLESLSRHAEGQATNEAEGSSVSDLGGIFTLDKSILTFKKLTFSVPGAEVRLQGTYTLPSEQLDFRGDLRMQAKLSKTVTGKKSFFLKAIDPFFAKKGAGTQLPIRVSGTRANPTIGVSVFHKTMKKNLGGQNSSPK
jgi:hypothetical protein